MSDQIELEALHLDHEVVTPQMVNGIYAAGMRCRVYTVNKGADMSRMLEAGVDMVIIDLPEAFL